EANCQKALEMIRNSTIIQDSYAVAHQYCEGAASALKQLPDTRERQSLLDLVSYVTERRR
ncbi:MAG: solanesyl diphosphate synthase, partial [SAR324 cluster bacterium]|nr:solanesyl diphosphate synthase [SAR324 cluster bacterium]